MTRLWLAGLVASLAAPANGSPRPPDAWLEEEVHFLISTVERARFELLRTPESRERFMAEFWRRRSGEGSPSARREEHLRRLTACDRLFGSGRRRGRFTERGRIYQLLGPPSFRQSVDHRGDRIVPAELWQYDGIGHAFLPPSFYLVFFEPAGAADFRLWSPLSDGVEALVKLTDPGRVRLEGAFDVLFDLDPELALAVRSLVPGASPDRAAFTALELLGELDRLKELLYRDPFSERVTVLSDFARLRTHLVAAVLFDEALLPQLHYALELPAPQGDRLGVRKGGERSLLDFVLAGRILDVRGKEIDRWEDRLTLDLASDEAARLRTTPLSFQGRVPIVSGQWRLEMLLQSEGGGTGFASTSLEVHEPTASSAMTASLVLARSVHEVPLGTSGYPFQSGGLVVAPSATLTPAVAVLQLATAKPGGLPRELALEWRLSDDKGALWEHRALAKVSGPVAIATVSLPKAHLAEGERVLEVSYPGGQTSQRFVVRAGDSSGSVQVLARQGSMQSEDMVRRGRALLFARRGELQRAIEETRHAVRLSPSRVELRLQLAALLYEASRHEEVIALLLDLAERDPADVDVLVFLAGSSRALGRSAEAVRFYERALALAPDDDRIATALRDARTRLR